MSRWVEGQSSLSNQGFPRRAFERESSASEHARVSFVPVPAYRVHFRVVVVPVRYAGDNLGSTVTARESVASVARSPSADHPDPTCRAPSLVPGAHEVESEENPVLGGWCFVQGLAGVVLGLVLVYGAGCCGIAVPAGAGVPRLRAC